MKAEDLMIGDLVYYSYANPFVAKVIDVCSHGEEPFIRCKRDEKDNLYKQGQLEDFHVGILRPIPLTSEILEKNGFKKLNYRKWGHASSNSEIYAYNITNYMIDGFQLEVTKGGFALVDNCSDSGDYGYESNWIADVNYVHKLQHLIRDLEVEKEIVL